MSAVVARFGGGTPSPLAPTGVSRNYVPPAPSLLMVKAKGDPSRSFQFTISTASVDRMGDSIAVNGWKLDAFRKNPVVLWNHDGKSLPVGRATQVWVQNNKLKAIAELAPASVYPYAETVRSMIAGGFLNATSVGFAPIKYKFTDDKRRPLGIDFIEQELLEFSVVSIPANADALLDAGQSSKGWNNPAAKRARELDLVRVRIREDAS